MLYIYCDESCHLEKDLSDVMVLGGISVPEFKKREVFQDIREIKEKHNLSTWFEIKWSKVSYSKVDFYIDLVNYFFNNEHLGFRGIVMKGKKQLDHDRFGNTFDDWYYKMYYYLLNPMIYPEGNYRIFIDIKDTNGGKKVKSLHEVLSNSHYDFSHNVIKDIKQIHSNESEVMQLCDLFIGSLSYYHRGLYHSGKNEGKRLLINNIIQNAGRGLDLNTPVRENKFNLFIWTPQEVQ